MYTLKKKIPSFFIPTFQAGGLVYRDNIYTNPTNTQQIYNAVSSPIDMGGRGGQQVFQNNMALANQRTQGMQLVSQMNQQNINTMIAQKELEMRKEQALMQKEAHDYQIAKFGADQLEKYTDKITGLSIDPKNQEYISSVANELGLDAVPDNYNTPEGVLSYSQKYSKLLNHPGVKKVIAHDAKQTEAKKYIDEMEANLAKIPVEDRHKYNYKEMVSKVKDARMAMINGEIPKDEDGSISNSYFDQMDTLVADLKGSSLDITPEYQQRLDENNAIADLIQSNTAREAKIAADLKQNILDAQEKPITKDYTIEDRDKEIKSLEGKLKAAVGSNLDPLDAEKINTERARQGKLLAETSKIMRESGGNIPPEVREVLMNELVASGIPEAQAYMLTGDADRLNELTKQNAAASYKAALDATTSGTASGGSNSGVFLKKDGRIDTSKTSINIGNGESHYLDSNGIKNIIQKLGPVEDYNARYNIMDSYEAGNETQVKLVEPANEPAYIVTNNPKLYMQAKGMTEEEFKDYGQEWGELAKSNIDGAPLADGSRGVKIPLSELVYNNNQSEALSPSETKAKNNLFSFDTDNGPVNVNIAEADQIYSDKSLFNRTVIDAVINDHDSVSYLFDENKAKAFSKLKYTDENSKERANLIAGWEGTPDKDPSDPEYKPELNPKLKNLAILLSKQFEDIVFTSFSRSNNEYQQIKATVAKNRQLSHPNESEADRMAYVDKEVNPNSGHFKGHGIDIRYNKEIYDHLTSIATKGNNGLWYIPGKGGQTNLFMFKAHEGSSYHIDLKILGER